MNRKKSNQGEARLVRLAICLPVGGGTGATLQEAPGVALAIFSRPRPGRDPY